MSHVVAFEHEVALRVEAGREGGLHPPVLEGDESDFMPEFAAHREPLNAKTMRGGRPRRRRSAYLACRVMALPLTSALMVTPVSSGVKAMFFTSGAEPSPGSLNVTR